MKPSQLLRGAVKHLALTYYDVGARDKDLYICNAIRYYAHSVPEKDRDKAVYAQIQLVRHIEVLLRQDSEHNLTLDGWVRLNVPGSKRLKSRNHALWIDQMQAYRHRWVQHLIVEFEAEGE
jgi:hypothetical protein